MSIWQRRLRRLRPEDPATVGSYTLVGLVGAGGMGTVYAACGSELSGYIAIKVIHAEHAADPEFRRQFAREARLMARVNSLCVPRFIRADVEADPPWIATEFVPGPTLRHRVERRGALRGGRLLGLAAGVAEALRAIHAVGVVHRDLKPSNILLGPDGPRVLDFGIARAPEDPTLWLRLRRMRQRTRALGIRNPPSLPVRPGAPEAGAIPPDHLGTPGWISPEQYRGMAPTPRSDVFLWGGVVAFAGGRRDPFGRSGPGEMARRVLREEPDIAGLPPDLERLVRSAMSKDPDDRPDPAELLRMVLELAPGSGSTTGAARPSGDRRAVQALLEREWTRPHADMPKPPSRPLTETLRGWLPALR